MQFDWFLSVIEEKRLENHEIYYTEAAEFVALEISTLRTSPRMEVPLEGSYSNTRSSLTNFFIFSLFLLQVDDRLTLAERNERLQNQLRSLKDELSHTTVESGETTMDRIHKENVKQGRDKYKTLREVRKGNTKRRVDQFENM